MLDLDPAARLDLILGKVGDDAAPEIADHVRAIASTSNGLPIRVAAYDQAEVFGRLRRVANTIEADPDAPTLEEVREMIDDAMNTDDLEAAVGEDAYTDVWVKGPKGWQMTAWQSTPLP